MDLDLQIFRNVRSSEDAWLVKPSVHTNDIKIGIRIFLCRLCNPSKINIRSDGSRVLEGWNQDPGKEGVDVPNFGNTRFDF